AQAGDKEVSAMETIELTLEKRTLKGKQVNQLRRQGLVPGVVYGHHFDPVAVQVPAKVLLPVLNRAGFTHLVDLRLPEWPKPEKALVREVQRDPITNAVLHVDFFRVSLTERIRAEVPITFVGEFPLRDSANAVLLYGVDSIEVECLPGDLPEAVEVNLAELREIGQTVYVRDLKLSNKVEVLTHPDELVVKVEPAEVPEEVAEEAGKAEESSPAE
ncbi:MAG: 50S ribosomal protein L25, partial [Anaerolineae bacterium]